MNLGINGGSLLSPGCRSALQPLFPIELSLHTGMAIRNRVSTHLVHIRRGYEYAALPVHTPLVVLLDDRRGVCDR